MYVGVGSRGRFRIVMMFLGIERFREISIYWIPEFQMAPEFRRVLVYVAEASSGRFWGSHRVPVCAGVGYGGRIRKVPKNYDVVCCLTILLGAAI